jgi:hypothetical protein
MAVRLVCRGCGKRLKFPAGADPSGAAKCPKCGARIDPSAALEASAYLPAVAAPDGSAAPGFRSGPPQPTVVPKPGTGTAPRPAAPPAAPLSLDDDDEPGGPAADPPFRVPGRVLADSLQQIVGPCSAVFVAHGLFLEREPMKPFLYVPVGGRADALGAGELLVTSPDGRAVAVRFHGPAPLALARDARAFLRAERPAPLAADYRRKWWVLGAAAVFALGLAGGPLMLSRTASLSSEFGLRVAAGFALAGFVGNAAVALVSRRSVPGQLATMAGICAVLTAVFLFGEAAYLTGQQRGMAEAQADAQPPPPEPASPDRGTPAPNPPEPKSAEPPAAARTPPTHIGRASANGVSALDDGPADVTALALAPDGTTLGIGYADGSTRLCLLDQPTFEPILPGPKADGPVSRVRFDGTGRFVFVVSPTGAVAAPRAGPFKTLAKIPGGPIAIAPDLAADRVRFAAVRGNTIQPRSLAIAFVQRPPPVKPKDTGVAYAFPGKGDEVVPPNSGPDPTKPGGPAGPTFLAWGPGGRLFAGQTDGAIAIWSNSVRPEAANRDHKAAVRAWADCAAGDFATGDDQGVVAWWPSKGGKPTVAPVLTPPGAIAALALAPSGTRLAAADATGRLVIWDVAAGKAVRQSRRPTPVKALAFGPNDDILIVGAGKAVEVWWVPKLAE